MSLRSINLNYCAAILPLLILLIIQYYRVNQLAPAPEYIWDNIYLWDWARSFSHGDFRNFLTDSHHLMRWGNWLPAAIMIQLFSDSVLVYYLSTIIPSTLGIAIFTYLAYRHLGLIPALIFICLWHYDALLFRATFQLLPSGAGLLPSAIMLAMCLQLPHKTDISTRWVVLATLTLFWLYGTKETHLAFMPGVLLLMWRSNGVKPVFMLLGLFAFGYLLETIAFNLISPDMPILGRVAALIDGGQHVKIMTENSHYVGQQTQYFDSGLTLRWMRTSGVTPVVIFVAFILGLIALMKLETSASKHDTVTVLSVLIISFIFFTTFFVISVNPIRLGHGLVPRYATLLMPFSYLLIIAFLSRESANASSKYKFALILIIPFFIAPSIDRYKGYEPLDIKEISRRYDQFGEDLKKFECVRARKKSVLMNQLDLVPERYRDVRLKALITNDDLLVAENKWFVTKTIIDKECQSMYTIGRNETMRY